MTDEQWQRLAPFAEADSKARAAFESARAINVPTDVRKRLESDLYYRRIQVEMQEASRAYEAARIRIIGE